MASRRLPKGYFDETEAARSLGITVEKFRELVREHIVHSDEEMGNVSNTIYLSSDVMYLRWIITSEWTAANEPVLR